MKYANAIIDSYNAAVGAIVAVLSYILGEHWILFVAFLLLNVADWLTGWVKSRMAGKENSVRGWKGVLKKLGYWLMIMVAFGASAVFIEIGVVIGIDLGITTLLGWFVLASVLTYLYLTQLFFCFMPFHDILKRNGGDSLWQDLKHIILYSVTMKCQLFVRLLGIRKPVKPS